MRSPVANSKDIDTAEPGVLDPSEGFEIGPGVYDRDVHRLPDLQRLLFGGGDHSLGIFFERAHACKTHRSGTPSFTFAAVFVTPQAQTFGGAFGEPPYPIRRGRRFLPILPIATSGPVALADLGLGKFECRRVTDEVDMPIHGVLSLRRAQKHRERFIVDEPIDLGGDPLELRRVGLRYELSHKVLELRNRRTRPERSARVVILAVQDSRRRVRGQVEPGVCQHVERQR